MPNNERLEHQGGAVPTTLAVDMTSGITAAQLASATNWPTGSVGPFYVVIDPGESNEEKVLATSRTSNQLNTLTRGVDGTAASAHVTGAVVMHIFSADEADEANALVAGVYGGFAAKGAEIIATGAATFAGLPVGTNEYVKVADSAQTTGQKWRQAPWYSAWGVLAQGVATSNQGSITTIADITGTSITWTAVANRYYKATLAGVTLAETAGTVTTAQVILDIGGSQVALTVANSVPSTGVTIPTLVLPFTIAAGSHTIKARAAVTAGGGTMTTVAAANAPLVLILEDAGASAAP